MKKKAPSSGVFWINGIQHLGQQLALTFTYGKRLISSATAKRGFVWMRPDGKQIVCRDTRALAKAIMNYDGACLRRLVDQARRMGFRAG